MKIKELEERTGLKRSTIRLYEQYGLIAPHTEEQNGRTLRIYSEEDAEQLRTVATLRKALFSMDEIKRMTEDPELIGPILKDHRIKVDQMAEELAALQTALAGIQSAPSSARALSRELEQMPIQKLPVPPADVHPRYRELDELYPPTEPEDNWPTANYFSRSYYIWLKIVIVLTLILSFVNVFRAYHGKRLVEVPADSGFRGSYMHRYYFDDFTETDGRTEWSFTEVNTGQGSATLVRTEDGGTVTWTLTRVVELEYYGGDTRIDQLRRIDGPDGSRVELPDGTPVYGRDSNVIDRFVVASQDMKPGMALKEIWQGFLFLVVSMLLALVLFHIVYGGVQVRLGYTFGLTAKVSMERFIPGIKNRPRIIMMIDMEKMSKMQRDFVSLYGRGT